MKRMIICGYLVLASLPAFASDEKEVDDDKGIFGVVLENDLFAGTDRD